MPLVNWSGRIGMSALIVVVKKLCHLYITYQAPILSYIAGSSLTTLQKTTLTDWLNVASAACAILVSLQYSYEN